MSKFKRIIVTNDIPRTMTPKEKAESLVHQYRMLLMAYGEDYGEELLVTFLSVESAIQCVEEILNLYWGGNEISQCYWMEVAVELRLIKIQC